MVVPMVTGFAATIDEFIWNLGASTHPNLGERTFLRGIHHHKAVLALAHWIAATIPGHAARVTSAWVDRYPQTYPAAGGFNCEIGDLLVVCRLLDRSGTIRRRVGWLLQAKMADDPRIMMHSDKSSRNEVALYEHAPNWDFEVRHAGSSLGVFDLRKDPDISHSNVPPAATRHWNYLQICRLARWPDRTWPTPLQYLWDSMRSNQAGGFCDGVTCMMHQRPSRGVELGGGNVEWTRLCDALLRFTQGRDSRLAGGLWKRTCTALVPDTWPNAAQLRAHFARTAAIDLDFPIGSTGWRPDAFTFAFSAASGMPPDDSDPNSEPFETDDGGFGVVVLDAISPTRDGDEKFDDP